MEKRKIKKVDKFKEMEEERARKERKKQARDDFLEKLFREVENNPCLWDRSSSEYKNASVKSKAWEKISDLLNTPVADLRVKWKNSADVFRRNLDTCYKHKSGDAFDDDKLQAINWKFFQTLMFLKDSFRRRRTTSSYSEDGSQEGGTCSPNEDFDTTSLIEPEVNNLRSESAVRENLEPDPNHFSAKIERAKRPCQNTVLAQISSNSEMIANILKENQQEEERRPFLSYLETLMRDVPSSKRRRCEQAILDIVDAFTSDSDVQIIDFPLPASN